MSTISVEERTGFKSWVLPGQTMTQLLAIFSVLGVALGTLLLARFSFDGQQPQIYRAIIACLTTIPEQILISLIRRFFQPDTLGKRGNILLILYLIVSTGSINTIRSIFEPYDFHEYMNPDKTTVVFKVLWILNNVIFFGNVALVIPGLYWRSQKQLETASHPTVLTSQEILDGPEETTNENITVVSKKIPWGWITVHAFVFFTLIAKCFEMLSIDLTSVIAAGLVPVLTALYRDRNLRHHKPYLVALSVVSVGVPIVLGWTVFQVIMTAKTLGLDNTLAQIIVLMFWTVFMTFLRFTIRHMAVVAIEPRYSLVLQITIQWTEDLFARLLFLGNLTDIALYTAVGWNLARSFLRMQGFLHFRVFDIFVWIIKKRKVRQHERVLMLSEQKCIAEVVCFSELLASLIVPILLLVDTLLTTIGLGHPSLTYQLTGTTNVLIALGILGVLQTLIYPVSKYVVGVQLGHARQQIEDASRSPSTESAVISMEDLKGNAEMTQMRFGKRQMRL